MSTALACLATTLVVLGMIAQGVAVKRLARRVDGLSKQVEGHGNGDAEDRKEVKGKWSTL